MPREAGLSLRYGASRPGVRMTRGDFRLLLDAAGLIGALIACAYVPLSRRAQRALCLTLALAYLSGILDGLADRMLSTITARVEVWCAPARPAPRPADTPAPTAGA